METAQKIKKTILIVEDEKDLRFFLSSTLSQEGFEVMEATEAEEAFEKIKQKKPDLILLDIFLPKKSGYEFLTELKKSPQWEKIPVIIVSNLGQKEEIEKGMKLGAVDFLIKANFTLEEIVQRVKKLLES
jgi:DNA-binding response OmpR family regulator